MARKRSVDEGRETAPSQESRQESTQGTMLDSSESVVHKRAENHKSEQSRQFMDWKSDVANILLVDDRPENLLALEAMLGDMGQNLVRAYSGEEALKCLLRMDFAVILLDVQMPTMDGFETATLIRQRERSRYTPIIFLTAINRSDEHVFRGYSLGAVDYLFKPLVPEILRAKISTFVELHLKSEQLKRQADEIEEANIELERQLREVKRLNRELEVVNRELETFSYSVSHDLRAPLRRISGYSQALLEDYHEKLDEEGQSYLERVVAVCAEMGELIDDLLQLARVSRTKLTPDQVNLSHIVSRVAAELQGGQPERDATFTITDDIVVTGDERLLRILIENLMNNSWKFTQHHLTCHIEFGTLNHGDGQVYYIRDDGAGFDMEHAANLFGAFQRLHNENEFEGTGIGLATAQRIVHRHGGKIWAEAAPEQGATFYFTL